MAELEKVAERVLVAGVRALGGVSVKLTTVKGIPDRLVLLPGGVSVLVELKSPTGALSPAQRVQHARLAAIGHDVVVLSGKAGVEAWLRAVA